MNQPSLFGDNADKQAENAREETLISSISVLRELARESFRLPPNTHSSHRRKRPSSSGFTFSTLASLFAVAGCTLVRLPVSIAAIVARPTSASLASSIWVRPRRRRCSFKRDKIIRGFCLISIAFSTRI